MSVNTTYFLATQDIAQRTGLVGKRYVTQDGRFILDNKDLSRLRLTPEEYITGLQGIERVNAAQVQTLIALGGYSMQPKVVEEEESGNEQEQEIEQEQETEE